MTFCIITHVPHSINEERLFAYAPYVKEMNVWLKHVSKVALVAPTSKENNLTIPYEHDGIQFHSIPKMDLLSLKSFFMSLIYMPKITWKIFKAMKNADHIHLRCPGNVGLLACFVQILFPKKPKTAKYAGNWDPKSDQPFTYKLQRWILNNTFLTKNIQVLVYGEWRGTSKNIRSFFTATYREEDKGLINSRTLNDTIHFLFIGTLSSGKRPLYAIKIVERLWRLGHRVSLQIFGEGVENVVLIEYCKTNQLNTIVGFNGNQTESVVREAYKKSHFLLLPSQSEGWPKVVAEAMFWGCLPIVTPVSCVENMLDHGKRGLLLKMDLDLDVEMIKTILEHQTEYDSKVQESILWSRKYTLDLFENEIRALLQS